jgi:hypothetical protein
MVLAPGTRLGPYEIESLIGSGLLYYLPTTPTVDIRNRVAGRAFDLQNGRVGFDELDVLTLSETIVPALINAVAPIVAGDQMVLLLGNYRGDVWIRVDTQGGGLSAAFHKYGDAPRAARRAAAKGATTDDTRARGTS